jgi:KipI family sensor histidine kinase inhibitor
MAGRIRPAGPRAVLLEPDGDEGGADLLGDARRVAALADLVREQVRRGALVAVDVVPGARTVLVDGVRPGDSQLLQELLDQGGPPSEHSGDGSVGGPVVELPTVYDGADLAAVAELWGVGPDEVVSRHSALVFQAAFCGFAPGFAYLAGLPADWSVPRRDQSRARVPAGSVGLAGAWCGVYPRASPGGWQLLGHTDVTLFDPDADPPALLRPGVRVRFVRC